MSWLENVDIDFACAELLSTTADGVVCPATIDMKAYGKISREIFERGGQELVQTVAAARAQLPQRELALGEATSIECRPGHRLGEFKRLIMVAIWAAESEYTRDLFHRAYVNSLREAFRHNLVSVALPVMAYDGNLKACGEAIVEVVHGMDRLKQSDSFSVKHVHFVSTKQTHIDYLVKEVEPMLY